MAEIPTTITRSYCPDCGLEITDPVSEWFDPHRRSAKYEGDGLAHVPELATYVLDFYERKL